MLTENFRYLKEQKRSPPKWVARKNKLKRRQKGNCLHARGQAAVRGKVPAPCEVPSAAGTERQLGGVSGERAHQFSCAGGLCCRPALPSLRRASSDASRAWALRLWRTNPGEDEGWLQTSRRAWRVVWRPPARVYGRNLGLPQKRSALVAKGHWNGGSENNSLTFGVLRVGVV